MQLNGKFHRIPIIPAEAGERLNGNTFAVIDLSAKVPRGRPRFGMQEASCTCGPDRRYQSPYFSRMASLLYLSVPYHGVMRN